MGIFDKKDPRQRKYKVPRGTGAELARETGLAESHISRVIRGHRTPGQELHERLVAIENENKGRK
jgi:transcriptional regulator with XRE-family HTH domain